MPANCCTDSPHGIWYHLCPHLHPLQALLSAVKSSFAALQRRLTWWGSADKSGTATPGGTNGNTISADSGSAGSAPIEAPTITSLQQYQQHALRPVFKVDLQLLGPTVVLQPSLDDIQDTISSTAQMVGPCAVCQRWWWWQWRCLW
jgi:hypothetical protein